MSALADDSRVRRQVRFAVALALVCACGESESGGGSIEPLPPKPGKGSTAEDPNKPPRPDQPDPPDSCVVRGQVQGLALIDRSIIGSPVDYTADATLVERERELVSSQRARREAAWAMAAQVLAPVKLAAEGLPNVSDPNLPAFQTWHAADDLKRMFNRVYPELSPEERAARAAFPAGALRRTFAWNDHAIDEFEEWTDERIAAYREALDDATKVSGLGGVTRVAYSPAASEHLLASYGDVLRCMDRNPDDVSPAPTVKTETLFDRRLEVARCQDASLDAVALEEHDTVTVAFAAESEGKLVARFLPTYGSEPETCEPHEDAPCTFTGKGELTIVASAETRAFVGRLEVTRRREERPWAPCLASAFARNAVVIKADWRRSELGIKLPVYDTSAEALTARFASSPNPSWSEPDRRADPGPDDIYTITLPNGNRFRMAALHIMTKELDHWFWTTLWWSDKPNEDFGADRPSSIPAAFRNYKMCTTVAFAEQDADPEGGYGSEHESLARALRATHPGKGGPTWCSNPYLEEGDGNAVTNCIGCHQHAGTLVRQERIITEPDRFPAHGRTRLREDFLSDYVYALTAGDSLDALFKETETHFATPGPEEMP